MGPPEQILYPDGYVCHGVFCGRIGSGDGCSYSIPSDCPEDIALQIFALHWQCGRIHQSWPHPTDIYKRGKRLHTCGHHEEHQDLPDGGRDELQDLHEGGEDQDVPQNLHEGGQGQDKHHVMPQPTDDQPELPQLTGGQKLLDVGLPQAIDGQPELRQLTDGVREESVQTIQLEDDKTDVLVSQDDGSYLHDGHSHSWSEDDQSWLAHKTWAGDCSSWLTEDSLATWQDEPSPVWHRTPLTDDGREGELKIQVTPYDSDEDGVKQQHDVQSDLQLPDVGLPQATVAQPELRQLTDSAGVREERDRGQSLCSTLQVTHDAVNSNGNKLSRKDLDQVPLMFNCKSSLDILALASFRTFDGGGISLVEEIMTHYMCTVQPGLCLS